MDGAEVDHLTAKLLAQWNWRSDTQSGSIRRRCPSPEPSASPCSSCSSSSPEAPGEMFSDYSYGRKVGQTKSSRPKMSTKRRMKASEREKMRMRSLAEALHQLRDYLPPVYSRRGQPLTKIQTLKYTIEYIKELSEILNQEWTDTEKVMDTGHSPKSASILGGLKVSLYRNVPKVWCKYLFWHKVVFFFLPPPVFLFMSLRIKYFQKEMME